MNVVVDGGLYDPLFCTHSRSGPTGVVKCCKEEEGECSAIIDGVECSRAADVAQATALKRSTSSLI